MKRILLTLTVSCLTLGAWAQDTDYTYYAEMLSRNNYYGTARSVALGNAMTALGGDLGSVGINPAGSAVNSFGQITITPAMLFQSTDAAWSSGSAGAYSAPQGTFHPKFNLPNAGAVVAFYSDGRSSVKYVTVGFLVNTTNTFLNYSTSRGENDATSFLGNLAAQASVLPQNSWYDDIWSAYDTGQIYEYGPEGSGRYAGSNQMINNAETFCYVPGALNQTFVHSTYGTKSDIIMNMGFNIYDTFYFGFNLGLPTAKYRRTYGFYESAVTPVSFPVNLVDKNGAHVGVEGEPTTYYKSSSNISKLEAEANGVYGKFGFIWLPTKSLRIGAAIQTPSSLTIEEQYSYDANTYYENSRYDGSLRDPYSDGDGYRLRTPYIVNAGLAYTFGGFGLISADYELTDYSVMKYTDLDRNYMAADSWSGTNQCNHLFRGVSHSLRAGLEIKPIPELSLRAGYSLVTSPERYAYDYNGAVVTASNWNSNIGTALTDFRYVKSNTAAYSLGIGFSSSGPFFADAAVRLTKYPTQHFSPYYFDEFPVYDKNGSMVDAGIPDITFDRKIVDVVLTFGWRF